jgi:hypothetical protein
MLFHDQQKKWLAGRFGFWWVRGYSRYEKNFPVLRILQYFEILKQINPVRNTKLAVSF